MAATDDEDVRKLCVAIDRLSSNEKEFLETSLILAKIFQNAVSFFHADDDRYRRLRRSSPVVARSGVHQFLRSAGFVDTNDDRGAFLVLPSSASLPCIEQHKRFLLAQRRTHNVLEAFEVPALSLHATRRIGKGKFGEVYCGTWDDQPVAIKRLKAECDAQVLRDFRQEAYLMHMMSKPQHRNIVELLAVVLTDNYSFIVMELMKGCFVNMLREGLAGTPREQLEAVSQVASGMAHLHERRILHCDLAARNILLAEDGMLKISDFGLARMAGSLECNVGGKGGKFPIRWSAPELFTGSPLSKETDVWSFGVLFFEFVTAGSMPYGDFTNDETKRRVLDKYRLPQPQSCPDEFYAIMRRCWAKKPSARPMFSVLVSELGKLKKKFPRDEVARLSRDEIHRSETDSPISLYSLGSMDSCGSGDLMSQGTDTLSAGSGSSMLSGGKEKDKEKKPRNMLSKRFTFGRSRGTTLKGIELIRIYTLLVDQFQTYVVVPVKAKHLGPDVVNMVLKRMGKPSSCAPSFHLVEVRKGSGNTGLQSRFLFDSESPVTLKANWHADGYLLLCHAMAGHANLLEAIDSFLQDPQYVARLKQPMCGYLRKDAVHVPGQKISRKWWSYWAVVDGSTVLFYQSEEAQEMQDDPMCHISLNEASIDLHEMSRKADAIPAVRVITASGETHLLQASSKDAMYRWLEALLSSINLEPSVLMEDYSCRLIHKGHLTVTREFLQTPNEPSADLGRDLYALKGQHLIVRPSRQQLFSIPSVVTINVKNPPEVPVKLATSPDPMSRLSAAAAKKGLMEYGIQVDTTGYEVGVVRYFLQPDTPGELEAWVEAFDSILLELGRSELMLPVCDEDDIVSENDSGQGISVDDLTSPRSGHELPGKVREEDNPRKRNSVADKGSVSEPLLGSRGSPTRLSIRRRSCQGYSMAFASEGSMAESGIYDSDDIAPCQKMGSFLSEETSTPLDDSSGEPLELAGLTGKQVASWLQGVAEGDSPVHATEEPLSPVQFQEIDEDLDADRTLVAAECDVDHQSSPSHSLSSAATESSQSTVYEVIETDGTVEREEMAPCRPPSPKLTSVLAKRPVGKGRGPPPPPPQRKTKPVAAPRQAGRHTPDTRGRIIGENDMSVGRQQEVNESDLSNESPDDAKNTTVSLKSAAGPVPSPRKRSAINPVSPKPCQQYEINSSPSKLMSTTTGDQASNKLKEDGNNEGERTISEINIKTESAGIRDQSISALDTTSCPLQDSSVTRNPPLPRRGQAESSAIYSRSASPTIVSEGSVATAASSIAEGSPRHTLSNSVSTSQLSRASNTATKSRPPLPPELPEKQKRRGTGDSTKEEIETEQPPPLPAKSSRPPHKSQQATKEDSLMHRRMTAPTLPTAADTDEASQQAMVKAGVTTSLSNPAIKLSSGSNSLPRKNSRSNSLPDAGIPAYRQSAQSVNVFGMPVSLGSVSIRDAARLPPKHTTRSRGELSSTSSVSSSSSAASSMSMPRPQPVAGDWHEDYMSMSSTAPADISPIGRKVNHEYTEIDYRQGVSPEGAYSELYMTMAPAPDVIKTEEGALAGDGEYVQMASNTTRPNKEASNQKGQPSPRATRKYEVVNLPMPSAHVPPPVVGNGARMLTPGLPEPIAETEAPYGFHSLPNRSVRHHDSRSPSKSSLFTAQRSVILPAVKGKDSEKDRRDKLKSLSVDQVAGTGIATRRRGSGDPAKMKAAETASKDLPPGWKVGIDSAGKTMYCHIVHQNLRVSSLAMVKRAEQLISVRSDESPVPRASQSQDPGPGWKAAYDPSGKTYYYHSKTKRTTWRISDTWVEEK